MIGYLFQVGGVAITWQSKKQSCTVCLRTRFTAVRCCEVGFEQKHVAWLTAKAISGRVLIDKYNKLPTID